MARSQMLGTAFKVFVRVFQCCMYVIVKPYVCLKALFTKKRQVTPLSNPLLYCSAEELAVKIRTRQVTSQEVVQAFITRTKEVNPIVNGVVQDRFDEALKDAWGVDEDIRKNPDPKFWEIHKPLLGVPISIKESIGVSGMSNSAGIRPAKIAIQDAPAVANLKDAGAIPFIVTNTPELCLFWETYNYVTGTTNNPFNSKHTTGGSSGGEAALIGSGASPFGLGSDIVGSGRLPPHYCGVFGHKPTPRIISVKGHVPLSSDPEFDSFLVLSPIARHASDLKLILKAAAPQASKALCLDEPVNITKLKIHYMADHQGLVSFSVQSEINQAVHAAAHYFKSYGITPCKVKIKDFDSILWTTAVVMLSMKPPQLMLQKNEDDELRWSAVIFEMIKAFIGLSKFTIYSVIFCLITKVILLLPKSTLQKNREDKANLIKYFDEVLGDNGVLILPVTTNSAQLHYSTLYKHTTCVYQAVFNLLEMPSTSVPMGFDRNGLPIGVQVAATKNNDRLTLAVAKELENRFGGWALPKDGSTIKKDAISA